jgi:hypothetical protein
MNTNLILPDGTLLYNKWNDHMYMVVQMICHCEDRSTTLSTLKNIRTGKSWGGVSTRSMVTLEDFVLVEEDFKDWELIRLGAGFTNKHCADD